MKILLLPRFEDNSTVPCRCLIFNDYKVFCLSKVWAFSIHVGRLSAWLNISIFTLQNIIQTYFRYLESTSLHITKPDTRYDGCRYQIEMSPGLAGFQCYIWHRLLLHVPLKNERLVLGQKIEKSTWIASWTQNMTVCFQ